MDGSAAVMDRWRWDDPRPTAGARPLRRPRDRYYCALTSDVRASFAVCSVAFGWFWLAVYLVTLV